MRNFTILCVSLCALTLAACQPKPADEPAASSEAAPAPAVLTVETSWIDNDYTKTISFSNNGSAPIKVNQVVVNGLANDPDCNIKVFKTYAPGEKDTVSVPNCGRFTKFDIVGDTATYSMTVSQLQTDIAVTDYTSTDGTVRISNNSSSEYFLNTVVFNNMASDSKCNVKVFAKIEAHGYLDVNQNCGNFKSATLNFESGSIDVGDVD